MVVQDSSTRQMCAPGPLVLSFSTSVSHICKAQVAPRVETEKVEPCPGNSGAGKHANNCNAVYCAKRAQNTGGCGQTGFLMGTDI